MKKKKDKPCSEIVQLEEKIKYVTEYRDGLLQKRRKLTEKKFNISDYHIVICLAPFGYEIDLLDPREYNLGNAVIIHSECRDYSQDIDVEKASAKLIQFVKNLENIKGLCKAP